jgi:hypothetical protein
MQLAPHFDAQWSAPFLALADLCFLDATCRSARQDLQERWRQLALEMYRCLSLAVGGSSRCCGDLATSEGSWKRGLGRFALSLREFRRCSYHIDPAISTRVQGSRLQFLPQRAVCTCRVHVARNNCSLAVVLRERSSARGRVPQMLFLPNLGCIMSDDVTYVMAPGISGMRPREPFVGQVAVVISGGRVIFAMRRLEMDWETSTPMPLVFTEENHVGIYIMSKARGGEEPLCLVDILEAAPRCDAELLSRAERAEPMMEL